LAPSRLLTAAEAAEFLGIAIQTLAVWRMNKRCNIPYIKVGQSVRYRLADLEAWLASRTVVA
jgi:excisionase family DNA binding protein